MAELQEVDVIGSRDVSTERIKIISPAKRRAEEEKKDSRNTRAKNSGVTLSTLSEILRGASLFRIPNPTCMNMCSTLVPSAQFMYSVIYTMDRLVKNDKQFSQSTPQWMPLYTRLYYGILFIIQTLRCMSVNRLTDVDQDCVLQRFLEAYPLNRLSIAGPLLPFFKALTSCQAPKPGFGVIVPYIPHDLGADQASGHALRSYVRHLLPNLVGIFRGITNSRAVGQDPRDYDWNLENTAAQVASPVGPNGNTRMTQDARIMPGTIRPVPYTRREKLDWRDQPIHLSIPQFPANGGSLTIAEYLGFDQGLDWFGQLLEIMIQYNNHFRGNSTLSDCSVSDGDYLLVECQQATMYPDASGHRRGDVNNVDLSVFARSRADSVSKPCDDIGFATQINWHPAVNFAPVAQGEPTQFEGPWWNSVIAVNSVTLNPELTLSALVAQEYYIPKAKE